MPIMQLVHVVEGGERAQMSKRRGEFVTLDELIDDIGADAARFFMLQRSHDTTVDLDLELAREDLEREPGLLRPVRPRADREHPAQGGGGGRGRAPPRDFAALPAEPSERALIKRLCELPDEVAEAARGARRTGSARTGWRWRGLPRLLPRLPGGRGGGGGGGGGTARPLPAHQADDRAALGLLGISAPERM